MPYNIGVLVDGLAGVDIGVRLFSFSQFLHCPLNPFGGFQTGLLNLNPMDPMDQADPYGGFHRLDKK